MEGIAFYIYVSDNENGLIPFFRLYCHTDHLYTANEAEKRGS